MRFTIDPRSSTPPYEQLRRQVIDGVASGAYPAGMRLPTVRALATELGLAANTVARAYRELEADGVIVTRGRNGSSIAPDGDVIRRRAQEAAAAYAERIAALGLDAGEALELAAAALGARPTRSD